MQANMRQCSCTAFNAWKTLLFATWLGSGHGSMFRDQKHSPRTRIALNPSDPKSMPTLAYGHVLQSCHMAKPCQEGRMPSLHTSSKEQTGCPGCTIKIWLPTDTPSWVTMSFVHLGLSLANISDVLPWPSQQTRVAALVFSIVLPDTSS